MRRPLCASLDDHTPTPSPTPTPSTTRTFEKEKCDARVGSCTSSNSNPLRLDSEARPQGTTEPNRPATPSFLPDDFTKSLPRGSLEEALLDQDQDQFASHRHSYENITPYFTESRLAKVKRMITDSILMGRRKKEAEGEKENSGGGGPVSVCLRKESAIGDTFNELHIAVETCAATEIVLKPRKRKERLDSGGSMRQENKVIRSSSEERPEVKAEVNVRRVWSNDELKVLAEVNRDKPEKMVAAKVEIKSEIGGECAVQPMTDHKTVVTCEELEARRSSERSSRGWCGSVPRRRKVSRRAPPPERPSSPSHSFTKLDVASLHQQMEGSEPLTSRPKVLSPDEEPESPAVEALISPRNSLVMRLDYLDPNLPPSPPQTHLHAMRQHDKKERRLLKQISSIKRQVKRYEEGFQVEFGYAPSLVDKMANKDIKRLISEMSRLKIQLKQLKDEDTGKINVGAEIVHDDSAESSSLVGSPMESVKPIKTIEEALQDVQKRLEEKRVTSGRGLEIADLTGEQLMEEKLAVQKALLTLENTFGRPVAQRDRDLVRPLYQRYRALKRLVIRSTTGKLNSSASELATILEHEAMEFSPSVSVDVVEEVEEVAGLADVLDADPEDGTADDTGPSSSSSDSVAENLHALPLSQLLEQQKRLKEEKKTLRRSLREFDEGFQIETGRRPQKQDRLLIETIYLGYKQSKAKLRLLDALIAKKSQVKRNSC